MDRGDGPGAASDSRGADTIAQDWPLDRVRRAVEGIRFGEVRVMIQDGQIVQIDRVEKELLR